MKRFVLKIFSGMLAVITLVTGVSCNQRAPVNGDDLMQDIHKEEVSETSPDDQFLAGAMDFSVKLFQQVYKETEQNENTLISPLSVLIALAMTANGAKGETLTQMEEVLGSGLPIDELNGYLYALLKPGNNTESVSLTFANSIWFRDDKDRFTPNQDFLQKNANYYNAAVYKEPFNDQTVQDINNWVKNATDGEIKEVVNEIDPNTMMYLINALVFDGEWETQYVKNSIREGTFTTADGKEQTVEMMYGTEYLYLSDQKAIGFAKAYDGRKYSFVAMLPNKGVSLDDYIDSLSGTGFRTLLENGKNAMVHTRLPKFSYEYDISLNDTLIAMGMEDAFFSGIADFSGLGTSPEGSLYISQVLHKTFITVDELGTKAGAVTVVAMVTESAPLDYYEVYLERPFVFAIVETETGLPIFIGTVAEIQK